MKIFHKIFDKIIKLENLFLAWNEFKKGKQKKNDVMIFERHLEDNIFSLYDDLQKKKYKHQPYKTFHIWDPKFRVINKASVRDRIVHHALYIILYPIFDPTFISDSYSCRLGKGTHKAVNRLEMFTKKVSRNCRQDCFVLKCDIKKFFASVNHNILLKTIKRKIKDRDTLWLIEEIIESFGSAQRESKRGLPLGNLTSQLFANIYLNELDQFIKHDLKMKYYLRYTDDFVILDKDRKYLENLINKINNFLEHNLKLSLHPNKIIIRKLRQGVDYLGYVCLPYYRVLRTKTKKRMFKKIRSRIKDFRRGEIERESLNQSLQSYFGVLKHCSSYKLKQRLLNQIWFWLIE